MASSIDRLVSGLIGAAFGIRMLDDRRALWTRAAYGAVGFDLLRAAMLEPSSGLIGDTAKVVKGQVIRSASTGRAAVPLEFKEVRVKDIAERVARVHEQMAKGTRDPQIYALARTVLSRKCGGEWCVPERDAKAEVNAIHQEVQSRVRYVLDPVDYDAFQVSSKTLALGTGDCDDMVILEGAMLRSIGYQVRSRVFHTNGWPTWNHIALQVQLPSKEWMSLDPIIKNKPAGWEVPSTTWVREPRNFPVSEKGQPRLAKE